MDYNLNVPRGSDRHKHSETSCPAALYAILQQFADGEELNGTHAGRHLQNNGKEMVIKNKNYQPTGQDVNLYNHILDFNGDGRVSLEDF